jgi:hypothetical protein
VLVVIGFVDCITHCETERVLELGKAVLPVHESIEVGNYPLQILGKRGTRLGTDQRNIKKQ